METPKRQEKAPMGEAIAFLGTQTTHLTKEKTTYARRAG